ncbi:unnamed protein product [Bursaphelenchus xylophilus]|uniref:(pine wood nematode) hypothetical protein n=1 Tax=Bursaphelenchus xylophilus TaxID=6326 RepID=A0A1I7S434_BURXY|nr:unnamed protein product [Bursaphelenchus xylophilus]CAG9116676.1 unnamed protein product [Bursaphelenchus xylophilus]
MKGSSGPVEPNGLSDQVNHSLNSEVHGTTSMVQSDHVTHPNNIPSTSKGLTIRIDGDADDFDDAFDNGEVFNCQNCRLTMENAFKAHAAVAEMAKKISKFSEMEDELRQMSRMLEDRQSFVIEQKEKLDQAAKKEYEMMEQLRLAEERVENFRCQADLARGEAQTAKELVERATENQKKLDELQKVVNEMSAKHQETTMRLYSMAKLAAGLKEERDQLREKLANSTPFVHPMVLDSPVKTRARRRTQTDHSIVPSVSTDDEDLDISIGAIEPNDAIEEPPEILEEPRFLMNEYRNPVGIVIEEAANTNEKRNVEVEKPKRVRRERKSRRKGSVHTGDSTSTKKPESIQFNPAVGIEVGQAYESRSNMLIEEASSTKVKRRLEEPKKVRRSSRLDKSIEIEEPTTAKTVESRNTNTVAAVEMKQRCVSESSAVTEEASTTIGGKPFEDEELKKVRHGRRGRSEKASEIHESTSPKNIDTNEINDVLSTETEQLVHEESTVEIEELKLGVELEKCALEIEESHPEVTESTVEHTESVVETEESCLAVVDEETLQIAESPTTVMSVEEAAMEGFEPEADDFDLSINDLVIDEGTDLVIEEEEEAPAPEPSTSTTASLSSINNLHSQKPSTSQTEPKVATITIENYLPQPKLIRLQPQQIKEAEKRRTVSKTRSPPKIPTNFSEPPKKRSRRNSTRLTGPFSILPVPISQALKSKGPPTSRVVPPGVERLPPLFIDMPSEIDEIFNCSFLSSFSSFPLIDNIDKAISERTVGNRNKGKKTGTAKPRGKTLQQRVVKLLPHSSTARVQTRQSTRKSMEANPEPAQNVETVSAPNDKKKTPSKRGRKR